MRFVELALGRVAVAQYDEEDRIVGVVVLEAVVEDAGLVGAVALETEPAYAGRVWADVTGPLPFSTLILLHLRCAESSDRAQQAGRLVHEGSIVLIDAKNLSRPRKFGASGVNDILVWSLDSKRLLFAKREWRCFLLDDFESLVALAVETGKRRMIGTARCRVTSSGGGWIDLEVIP